MNRRTGLVIALLSASTGLWAGIHPRASAEDYPAHDKAPAAVVAAAVLSPAQVRNSFASDLNKGYIVLEVAVYPDRNGHAEIAADDFMLHLGNGSEVVRPVDSSTVASVLQQKNAPPPPNSRDVTLYPTASVGYESGGYDPETGRRTRGWTTGAGVGVGVGDQGSRFPQPASTTQDRRTMEAELHDKALPEGPTAAPVAGYLYFPVQSKSQKKNKGAYELEYLGDAGHSLHLSVPAPENK